MPKTDSFIVTHNGERHAIDDVVVHDNPPPYTVKFTVNAGVPLDNAFLFDAGAEVTVLHAFIAESVEVDSSAPSRVSVRGHYNPAPSEHPTEQEPNHDK